MTKHRFIQTLAAAAALLTSAAHASPVSTTAPTYGTINPGTTLSNSPVYVYSTSSAVPAAAGSLHFSDAANTGGGLCEISAGPCGPVALNIGQSYGPLISASYGTAATAGLIEAITPSAIGNYLLTVSVSNLPSGNTYTGDIYNIVVDGRSLGTTSIVSSTSAIASSGTFSTVITWSAADAATYGGTQVFISVTDLLQQYLGASTYDLPTQLGGPNFAADDGSGLVNDPQNPQQSVVALRASLVPDPEPASLSIFCAATVALGAARRRRRAKMTG